MTFFASIIKGICIPYPHNCVFSSCINIYMHWRLRTDSLRWSQCHINISASIIARRIVYHRIFLFHIQQCEAFIHSCQLWTNDDPYTYMNVVYRTCIETLWTTGCDVSLHRQRTIERLRASPKFHFSKTVLKWGNKKIFFIKMIDWLLFLIIDVQFHSLLSILSFKIVEFVGTNLS